MIIANNSEPDTELKGAPALPPKDRSRPPPISQLDQLPPPPPYSPAAGPSTAAPPPPRPVPLPRSPSSTIFRPQNAQTVNYFEVFSKHIPIEGTYLIDPTLPSVGPVPSTLRKQRRKRNRAWGKDGRGTSDINASFRTRHGAISLDLAVVAESPAIPPPGTPKVPATVVVSTRHGRINLNLFEAQPGRSVDLQVESRHGKITLLLPPTYDGPLLFETRNAGAVSFLPAFAARTRTLRASDRETLVVCTAPEEPGRPKPAPPMSPSQPGPDDGDRVFVRTRHGRITVGISGLDRVEETQIAGGLFKRLGELLEVGGRALGQYVEAHAAVLERKLSEKSVQIGKALDAKFPDSKSPASPTGRP
ncbi:hypothetical protein VTO73DRAFT_7906 [Trametes versicolor]